MAAHELDSLLRWMFGVVTDPRGVDAALQTQGDSPDERLVEHGGLSHAERLGIYASMYRARLVDAVHDDYEGLAVAMGPTAFSALVESYVDHVPSRHYSLDAYGRELASYIANEYEVLVPDREALVDIARCEWAMVESFSAEDCEILSPQSVVEVPPDALGDLVLMPAPALRLLELSYPLEDWLDACFCSEAADGGAKQLRLPARGRAWLAVHRLDGRACYVGLEGAAFALLQRLARAEPLGVALEGLVEEDGFAADDVIPRLGEWFADWAGRGFFCAPPCD